MSRVSIGRRAATAALSSIVLIGAMLVPFAGVAAAGLHDMSNCSRRGRIGSLCFLRISAPNSVETGTNSC